MARDKVESIAVIPNQVDNFDEVWMIVNRENGRFVERMVRRLNETDCGEIKVLLDEQVFMDSTVSYIDGQVATQVSQLGTVYTLTLEGHGFSNGDTVRLKNVAGVPALNNTTWTITSVTSNTFQLNTQVA